MTSQMIKPVAPRLDLALNNENSTQYSFRKISETQPRTAKPSLSMICCSVLFLSVYWLKFASIKV